MEIKRNQKSKTQREIEVTLFPEEIEKYINAAVKKLSAEKEIPGFRPGMAPREMVEKIFGKEIVWQEASALAIKESYSQIMEKVDFLVVSQPKILIESIEPNKPLSFKIILEVLPEIVLPDYKEIAKEVLKEKREIEVEEKEVEETLKFLQNSRAKVREVKRGAREGDEVVIDFEGSIDGIPQAGLKSEKATFILGEEKFIEGFEKQLIGLSQGETKSFVLNVETLDSQGKLQKKEIKFNVKVHSVGERELPQLNDDFARSLGKFSDLKDLRQKLKENIKLEKELQEKERIRAKIIGTIIQKTNAEIPQTLIDRELDNMVEEFKAKIAQLGISFEDYLKKIQKNEENLRKEWVDEARQRVLGRLILEEIAKKENILVSDEEAKKEANAYLARFPGKISQLPEPEILKNYFKNLLRTEKVFQFLEKL